MRVGVRYLGLGGDSMPAVAARRGAGEPGVEVGKDTVREGELGAERPQAKDIVWRRGLPPPANGLLAASLHEGGALRKSGSGRGGAQAGAAEGGATTEVGAVEV